MRTIWEAYGAAIGRDRSSDFYEPFHFHDNNQGALELATLVLQGTKRGSASLVWTYEHDNKRPPWPGSLSIMTDWLGTPLGIIETRTIEAVPFDDVTAEFAASEGEGDLSLRYWRQGHWDYFTRECRRIGRRPDPRMLVFCERFDLVFAMNPGVPHAPAS
ncbi:DUF984 [Methylibium petroleiphilum PM1]|jgi:uncharacterized protein YhfF|uniref:DUF984 n=2 Tax=Sphaerotilaceae TaxID=2975441 RepID=A2SGK6_METPP|nr:DUF984 [Methylibium petroleiphilum PM1]